MINLFLLNFSNVCCIIPNNIGINKINIPIKIKENDKYEGRPEDNPPPKDEPIWPPEDDINDIYIKVDKLMAKEKELNVIYDSEYNKFLNYEIELKSQKTYLYFLIGIVVILFLILVIYSIYECLKFKRKTKIDLIKKKDLKFKSKNTELLSSSSSTFDSSEQNSLDKLPNNLNISSNFNILIHSQKIEKEDYVKGNYFNNNEDGDVAPVEYYASNNNIKDEIKTLTNNEDIYVESQTDKLLYKPYSEDELKK